jgi:hypothetical protein
MQEIGTKKIRLAYNKFAYKKTKDINKKGRGFVKMPISDCTYAKYQIIDKKIAYNEVRI